MSNNKQQELANLLEEYSDYLTLDGQDGRAHAYSRAARSIRKARYLPPDLSDLDNVGPSIRRTIARYQVSGELAELDELKEEYSWYGELRDVKYIGPERARTLHEKFSIDDIDDLLLVGDDITLIQGVGPKTAENILESARENNVR